MFLSTFHRAAESDPAAHRHLSIFSRCVEPDDPVILVTRCTRPGQPMAGSHHLLLTRRRLVVVQRTWPLRRQRLHLNTNLRHLSNVTWRADVDRPGFELAVTVMDGIRERFRLRLGDEVAVAETEESLRGIFLGKRGEPAPARKSRTVSSSVPVLA
ncbi:MULTISPECIES: hypothetical protein [Actinoplanes]|uniref:hypothetical protein n=1 Tax=Actinoplanes TaxID=1865 RepID=UPI001FE1C812|nr:MULTISPECIES: hypothetical protein [Actinoplanes]